DPWTSNLLQQLVLDVRGDARVLQVSDGHAALARCKRRLPDLVIADGELPGLDGLELLRQLRRHPRTPALPFVLISGRLDASSVRAAAQRLSGQTLQCRESASAPAHTHAGARECGGAVSAAAGQ